MHSQAMHSHLIFSLICISVGYSLAGPIPTTFAADKNASTVQVVAQGAGSHRPQQPQICIDSRGVIHLVYGVEHSIQYVRSADGGQSFSEPKTVFDGKQKLALGHRRGPRIAITGSNLCITAICGAEGKGRDGDLLAIRSPDKGETWAAPVQVNDHIDSAREGLHGMAAEPNGRIACTWLDLRNGKTELMCSTSSNGGETWSKNVVAYRSPDGSICECCQPSAAWDGNGRLFLLWRNQISGNRDMYVSISSDGGETFSSVNKQGTDSWMLNACPMDGGGITALSDGRLLTVWRRRENIYVSLNGEKEKSLGIGEQPWLASSKEGAWIVWLKKRGDAAYLLRPGQSDPLELARHAYDPVIASAAHQQQTGEQQSIVAAWETRDGQTTTICCQVIQR